MGGGLVGGRFGVGIRSDVAALSVVRTSVSVEDVSSATATATASTRTRVKHITLSVSLIGARVSNKSMRAIGSARRRSTLYWVGGVWVVVVFTHAGGGGVFCGGF